MIVARSCDGLLAGLVAGLALSVVLSMLGYDTRWALAVPIIAMIGGLVRSPSLSDAANFLDLAHNLHELLRTALSMIHANDEPWAESFVNEASRRAGNLPPLPLPVRFPPRWHATSALLWLATLLWIPAMHLPKAVAASQAVGNMSVQNNSGTQIAAAVFPEIDDTVSATRLPGVERIDATGDAASSNKVGDTPARGTGRADAENARTPVMIGDAASTEDPVHHVGTASNNGNGLPANAANARNQTRGTVAASAGALNGASIKVRDLKITSATDTTHAAQSVPDVYRPLVADFFAR